MRTHPGHDQLSSQVLHLGLHLAADVELVAVESDALQEGQQVLLAGRVGTLPNRQQTNKSDTVSHIQMNDQSTRPLSLQEEIFQAECPALNRRVAASDLANGILIPPLCP